MDGWAQAAVAVGVGLSRSRVQQLLKRDRTPQKTEKFRARVTARVTARAAELRASGIHPWAS